MTRFQIDSSGKSPPVIVQCKMPALQPLVDAGAFPGWGGMGAAADMFNDTLPKTQEDASAQLDYARFVVLKSEV